MKLTSYYTSSPDKKFYQRGYCLYGTFDPNISSPLVYLRKPKHLTEESFKKIVDAIRLELETQDIKFQSKK